MEERGVGMRVRHYCCPVMLIVILVILAAVPGYTLAESNQNGVVQKAATAPITKTATESEEGAAIQEETGEDSILSGFNRENTYENYIAKYKNISQPLSEIIIPAASFKNKSEAETKVIDNFMKEKNVLEWTNQKGWVEWIVEVPETGLYNLALKYYPIEGKRRDIEFELSIDGKLPFEGVMKIIFNRVWKDATVVKRDNRGNDITPEQIEEPMWRKDDFKDTEGLYNDAYKFYLEKGKHTLRLTSVREPVAIAWLKVYNRKPLPDYKSFAGVNSGKSFSSTWKVFVKQQAEAAYIKSDPTLHPIYDRSTPATEPYDISKIRLNTIGSDNWKYPGQWITWKLDVPEDGFYKIGIKYRQNTVRGFFTSRKIYIDGDILFDEMQNVQFAYDPQWKMKVLGDEEPWLFYLKKGAHEITMEVTLGDMAQTLRVIEESVYQLNYLYRKIIMITGVNPDLNRDYYLDKEIPGLVEKFQETGTTLKNEAKRLEKLTGHKGSEAVLLERMAEQLKSLADEPDTIGERLDRYKSNVSALAAWILDIKEQPLELDYITVSSPDVKLPKPQAGIFASIAYHVEAFTASFFEDYNNIGNTYDRKKSIEVWIGTGRDQAQVLKGMIDELFTTETGISVNLKLAPGALMQATMAGKGPDVALDVGRGEPINLAMRGAVVDLKRYKDFEGVSKRFFDNAMLPYEYQDSYYALPETQSFHMMFYRKDIFEELGIRPPETWEDLYGIYPVLQRNNMEIGIPYEMITAEQLIYTGMGAQTIFPALLYQLGGKFYNNDERSTAMHEPSAIKAFKQWTSFYTQYKFPYDYNFYNRFRTGEMPLGIQSYLTYSFFTVAAPEIRNLWEMVPIPGTRREDGSIDRTESASGTACIILNTANDKDAAWKFLKWWTSADIQSKYGRELEAIMGPSARYNTANLEAFSDIAWSEKEYRNLMDQWKQVREIPEIPGGYYTARNIDNAFRQVVFSVENDREALYYWSNDTDKEIARKRTEFGLN